MDLKTSESSPLSPPAGKKSSLLLRSAEGATFLIILQVGSRALTFAVNQFLLRYISPELLGISTQLEVYSISALFFARESLRVAIQRQTDTTEEDDNEVQDDISDLKSKKTGQSRRRLAAIKTQEVINLSYISIALGVLFATSLGWAYWRSLRSVQSILETPYFKLALELYALATFLELLAEPCFVVVQQKSEYKIRAAAEGTATICRCLITCSFAVLAAHRGINIGALPFAIGQLSYGLSLALVYYRKVYRLASAQGFSLRARPISLSNGTHVLSYFSRPLLTLGTSLFAQGAVKYLLTQGDVILISYLASLNDQGIYALVSNYGGLIARILFQPIEESSRNYFGKLLSTIDAKPSKAAIRSASKDLHNLLRFYVLLSICAISIGPTVAPPLLSLVAGSTWRATGAGDVLAKYCYYIPLLAINGVTEAFISSVASEKELNYQSAWMFAFSVGFSTAGYTFLQVFNMGAEGLVWANSINMILRIIWSYNYISNYLKRNGSKLSVMEVMPQSFTIAGGVCFPAIIARVKVNSMDHLGELIKSGLTAGVLVILLMISERQYLSQCYRIFRGERPGPHANISIRP